VLIFAARQPRGLQAQVLELAGCRAVELYISGRNSRRVSRGFRPC